MPEAKTVVTLNPKEVTDAVIAAAKTAIGGKAPGGSKAHFTVGEDGGVGAVTVEFTWANISRNGISHVSFVEEDKSDN